MKNFAIHPIITRSFAPATVWGVIGGLTLAVTAAAQAAPAYGDLTVDDSTTNTLTGFISGTTANNVYVGTTGMGTINENTGSLTVNPGQIFLGYGAGSFGTYNLSPTDDKPATHDLPAVITTLNTPSTDVGDDGIGVFNQNGGIHTTSSLDLAVYGDGSGGYNLNSGTLEATNSKGSVLGTSIAWGSGTGVFNLSGGNAIVNNLSGGSGTSIFNFNGGTLTAGASDHYTSGGSALPFIGGLTALNVGTGATIETQTYNVTVTQPLVHSTYGILDTITLRPNGSGYTSAPTVTLTGGGGFGATAVANINSSGQVTGITLTNAGFNYTSAPTATFSGGGGSGASATLTVFPSSAADGGVIKNGTGTLNLLADNTFNGPLVINAGTVVAPNNGSALPTSEVRLASAGTVNLSADSGVTLTQRGTTFTGAGTLEKSGAGAIYFGGNGTVNVSLSSGGKIDVEGGTLYGSNSYGGAYTNNNGSLNIASGAVFDGVEADVRVDALTGTGTLSGGYASGSTNLGSLTIGVANGSGTFAGVIQNDANSVLTLTKTGTGTQTLSGANTFTGGTTVQGGGLTLANQHALQNSTLTLNSGTTLNFDSGVTANAFTLAGLSGAADIVLANNAATPVGITLTVGGNNADLTYAGAFSGAGSLTKTGLGTLTLTGTSTNTGTTTIGAGTIQVGSGGTSGSLGSGNVVDNAALVFNRTDTATVPNAISGTGSVTQLGSGTLILTGSNSFRNGVSLQAGILGVGNDNALGVGNLSVAGAGGTLSASGGDHALNNSVNLGTGATLTLAPLAGDPHGLTFKSPINGAGSLVQSGGAVTLLSDDKFTGGLTLSGGAQLLVGSDSALGANGVSVSGTGGTLLAYSSDHLVSNGIGIATGAALTLSTDPASGAHNLTVNGIVSGAGSLIQNAGTQTLSASNTYTGGTTVSAGTLVESNNGNALSTGPVAISAGAMLALRNTTSSTVTQEGITFTGAGTIQKTGTGTLGFGGPGSVNVNLSSGGLIDVEGGTLAGSGSYNGVYTNNNGSLNIATGAAFDGVEGSVRVDKLTGTGTLSGGYYNGSTSVGSVTIGVANGSGTFAGVMQDDSSSARLTLIKTGTGTEILTGNSTSAGTVTINAGTIQVGSGGTSGGLGSGNVVDNAALVFNRTDTATVPNAISGTGSVTQNGSGTLALGGANTFSGGVNLATGTLAVGSNNALGSGSLSVSGTSGALYATGADCTLSNTISVGAGTTLTLTSVGGDVHNLTLNGIISGAGALVKNGTGTATLGGNNTFTGTVSLNGGTLAVANDGDLGTAASVLNLTAGRLLYTNDATTTRTFNLNNAVTLSPAAGRTLTFGSGANVNGGFLGAGGTYAFGDGSNLNGTTTALGSTVTVSGTTATFTNATLRGAVTQTSGTLAVTDTVLSSAGTLAVGGTMNTSGFESDGVVNLTSGGVLANTGTPLVLGGGSRTTVNAGTLSTTGTTIELNGGLLVLTNGGTQTGTLDVNYGSTAKGTNFGMVNVTDGGKFGTNTASSSMMVSAASSLSAGSALNRVASTPFVGPQLQVMPNGAAVGSLGLGSGSLLICNVADAQGAAGSGYDTVNVQGALTLGGSSTPGNLITIALGSLTSNGMNGAAANFDPSHAYVFTVATANGGITGFSPNEFSVDTSGFQNSLRGGHFFVAQDGSNLDVDFAPVPEPATWLAGGLVLGVVGMKLCRRLRVRGDAAGS